MEELPEEVRRRIVSFLPLNEAVRTTSLLSTAWRDLWRPRIVETDLNSDRIIHEIGKFLEFCGIHDLLRLSCQVRVRVLDDDSGYRQILAAKGVERELYLDFRNDEGETRLYALGFVAMDNKGSCSKFPSEVARFATLKNLHLKSVNHAFEELSSALFSRCELLERLTLEQCRGLKCLDITASGGALEDVAVIDCPDVVQISISSSSLKSFTYRGPLPQIKMENWRSVVDVTLHVNTIEGVDQNEFDCEELLSLFASLSNVEALSISGWLLEWLCLAGVIFQQLDIRFCRLLQLRISEPCMSITKLDSLASFLDICPSLEKLYIDFDSETEDVICPYFYQYWHEPYFGSEYSIFKAKSPSRLERLRVVEVSGFDVDECGLWLLDFLLKRALLLNSMTVRFHNGFRRRVVKLPLSQLSHARMNYKQKLMIVVSPNNDYYLGLIEV